MTRAALDDARHGQGPTLIEAYTYRMGAHTTSDDPTRYRIASEVEAWQAKDPITAGTRVPGASSSSPTTRSSPRSTTQANARGRRTCANGCSPCPTRSRVTMFDNVYPDGSPEVDEQREQFAALPGVVRGERPLMSRDHSPSARRSTPACAARWRTTPKVLIMGEDVGKLGGVFRITDGLQKDFGEERVIDTPLAESGIIGTAIGLAIRGYRPVCEIQFDGFVYPAYDQIVSQVAKMHYRSQGKVRLPIVIRIPFGGGIGAVEHHSESPEAYFAHTAGLKVVACSQPGRRVLR